MFRLILLLLLSCCSIDNNELTKYRVRYVFHCKDMEDIYVSESYYHLDSVEQFANMTGNIPEPFCNCDSLKIFITHGNKDSLIHKLVCIH